MHWSDSHFQLRLLHHGIPSGQEQDILTIALRAVRPRHLTSLLKNLLQSVGTSTMPGKSEESCGLMNNNYGGLSTLQTFPRLDMKKAAIRQFLPVCKRWVGRPKFKKLVSKKKVLIGFELRKAHPETE